MTSFGSSAGYAYDGGGLRTSKTVSATTNNFTYDTAEGLPLVLDDGTNAYVYGPGGMALEQVNSSAPIYLHLDQLGSTRLLTNSSGTVVGTYQFDAYGNTTHTGSVTTPMQYAGQYLDVESGLYWMRARYYDPTTGQFVSRDPLVDITSYAYGYTGGDPVDNKDDSGMFCVLGSLADGSCKGSAGNFVTNHPQAAKNIVDTSAGVLQGLTVGHANAFLPKSAQNSWNSDSALFFGGQLGGEALLSGFGSFGGGVRAAECAQSTRMVTVTSWAARGDEADLAAGRWVMKGGATRSNYVRSGAWGPQWPPLRTSSTSFENSITGQVPASRLQWPSGGEFFKGFVGQRRLG